MSFRSSRFRPDLRSAAALALLSALPAASAHGQVAPALAHSAVAIGQQRSSAPIAGTVWLQLHNKAALDAAVKDMYTPGSASFHQFAGADALKQFAPTVAEMAAVQKELAAHNLKIISADPMNFSVKIQGQTSDFEAAFHTTVNQYRTQTEVVTAMSTPPTLAGSATGMVQAVTGLGSKGMQPYIMQPVDPDTGKAVGVTPVTTGANPEGAFYSSQCLYASATRAFTAGATAAQYQGLIYGASIANTTRGTVSPCAYSPQDVYRIYGLNTAYGQGYTGKGQTIAIVDAYGSPTIDADLATFNLVYSLPRATGTSFRVLTPVPVTETNAGWAGETTLDVEWSHAIAPDADIVLVAAPSNSNDDLQSAVLYVIENHLSNVISNSYGLGELQSDPQSLTSWDEICELAAFTGISANFSSGDSGDYAAVEQGVTDVSSPASSPYATAIGGTSASFSPFDNSIVQTGWGTNITRLTTATTIDDPPQVRGFQFGAGGGVSQYFKKPAYQSAIQGTGRLLPDVSSLADPYTGVEIILTVSGQQVFEAIGGTSLASPIFSAEWALLSQRFGFPLGQAAPLIAQYANTLVVADVTTPYSPYNTQGAILDAAGFKYYSPEALAAPETNSPFLSAIYQGRSGSTYDLTFGTDSSLAVTPGFDTVTGWGTLDMGAIFTAFAK